MGLYPSYQYQKQSLRSLISGIEIMIFAGIAAATCLSTDLL